MKRQICMLLLLQPLLVMHAAGQQVLYVDDDAPAGGNGQTWSSAFSYLQDALAAAKTQSANVAEIRIAQGMYMPDRDAMNPRGTGDRTAYFQLLNGVKILGGFAGVGAPDPDSRDPSQWPSIVTGDLNNDDNLIFGTTDDNAHRLFRNDLAGGQYVLDGLVVERTNSLQASPQLNNAIRVTGGHITIRSCRLQYNKAESASGVHLQDGASAFVSDSVFFENFSNSVGGALRLMPGSVAHVHQCVFEKNRADYGGGIHVGAGMLTVNDSEFRRNQGDIHGASIYAVSSAVWTTDCTFVENHAIGDNYGGGGAVFASGTMGNSTVTATRCVYESNIASRGAALSVDYAADVIVDHCQFSNNTASNYSGSAIHVAITEVGRRFTCLSSSFVENVASGNSAVSCTGLAEIRNCLFSENKANRAPAILISQGGASVIAGSAFDLNSVPGNGSSAGAVELINCNGTQIIGCTFIGNIFVGSNDGGGAIYFDNSVASVFNTLFSGNRATDTYITGKGGGAILAETSNVTLRNCTLSHNNTNRLGGGIHAFQNSVINLVNCVLWQNSDSSGVAQSSQVYITSGSTVVANNSCVQGLSGSLGGFGNIGMNPQMVSPLGLDNVAGTLDDNCRLGPTSPCIDAGSSNTVNACYLDADEKLRVIDEPTVADTGAGPPPFPDMGAFEFGSIYLTDCNSDTIMDSCQQDCNANSLQDECDIEALGSLDCNGNLVPDECEIAGGALDCNTNGVIDSCEIAAGVADCNGNNVPDQCDLSHGESLDCNSNGQPDECDIAFGHESDCNNNGIPDSCDLAGGLVDCDQNGIPDSCDLSSGAANDCNGNGQLDTCDIAQQVSLDLNNNGVPDECDADCNSNGVADFWEIQQGLAEDCNRNLIPDTCDILPSGVSADCNKNQIPDECDLANGAADIDNNGVPDSCQLDCNANSLPDEFEVNAGLVADCNNNNVPDSCDVVSGTSADCNSNSIPDTCDVIVEIATNSGQLAPVNTGLTLQYVLADPPLAISAVSIQIAAIADLGSVFEYINVYLNGVQIGHLFESTGLNCPTVPNSTLITLSGLTFNNLTNGGAATFEIHPSSHVSSFECPNGYVTLSVAYIGQSPLDLDINGIPDTCQCEGDVAPPGGNGFVDVEDLLLVIQNWGANGGIADIWPAPLGDGTVNASDLIFLLQTWGRCP